MTVKLTDAVNHDGLFDVLGPGFHALDTLNTTLATTVPQGIEGFLEAFEAFDGAPLDYAAIPEGLPAGVASWQSSGAALASRVRTVSEALVVQMVTDDAPATAANVAACLAELVSQMETGGQYVEPCDVNLSLSAGEGNTGDVAILYTEKDGRGQVLDNTLAESVGIAVTSSATRRAPVLAWTGETATSSRLHHDWPAGSGASISLSATDPANSLLSNGDFEDTAIANTPDGWIVHVGTPGGSVRVTALEVQTITLSGTPTAGSYTLYWEDPDGVEHATTPLPYNATASQVQAALRLIPGLSAVTVTASGTSPNLTHTIIFHGGRGAVSELTSVNNTTGGTIVHATTVAADVGSYFGRALRIDCDGAEQTDLYHALTVEAETVYFCAFRLRRGITPEDPVEEGSTSLSTSVSPSPSPSPSPPPSPASGSLRVEIVECIEGAVLTDGAGTDNQLAIDLEDVSDDAHDAHFFSFRLPRSAGTLVYLRFYVETPTSAGHSIYIGDVVVVAGRQLYAGGPFVGAVAGAVPAIVGDTWTLAVTNDRAGKWQEWFSRVFPMASNGLLLPTSGDTEISDSLIDGEVDASPSPSPSAPY